MVERRNPICSEDFAKTWRLAAWWVQGIWCASTTSLISPSRKMASKLCYPSNVRFYVKYIERYIFLTTFLPPILPDICGGIIRDVNGIISSPNFPFFYPKNQTCTWWIIAPAHHTLKLTFLDINLPGLRRCKITDHVQIDDVFRNWNDTSVQSE